MTRLPASTYRKNTKAKKRVTMVRRNAKRDAAEPDIVKTLEAFGMSVFLLHEPTDAIVGYRGITHIVEFKSGRKGWRDTKNLKHDVEEGSELGNWLASLGGKTFAPVEMPGGDEEKSPASEAAENDGAGNGWVKE